MNRPALAGFEVTRDIFASTALPLRIIARFVWNKNGFSAIHQAWTEMLATAASKRDLSVFANAKESLKDGELPRALHFKNMFGNIAEDQVMPIGLQKTSAGLEDAKRLRGEVKSILQ